MYRQTQQNTLSWVRKCILNGVRHRQFFLRKLSSVADSVDESKENNAFVFDNNIDNDDR